MSNDSRRVVANTWHIATVSRDILGESCTIAYVEQEWEWIETTLTAIFDSHATR